MVVKHVQDNDLSEFDESRDIIESLVDEYKACESPDYIKWGMEVARCTSDLICLLLLSLLLMSSYVLAGSQPYAIGGRKCYWNSGP